MRVQRYLLALLITLALPVMGWAATFEMLPITSGAVVGITPGLCTYSPASVTPISEHGLFIHILDQSVYYTVHSATATPSGTVGGLAVANTIITVPRASELRAIAVATDARAYVLCVPK